ncbi:NAD-dependent epimerase/dehydratase family protein [uncultured Devosia sp.]|uniref:NAD-dependent epimerase/dehydratase family protein n=1 Tax=uncultured Devosia sp. TaxID=211434 RepID=UPI0035CC86A0
MSKGKVTVLGSNGHIGHHAAQAFQDAGWAVTAFGRNDRKPIAGVRFVAGDAADPGALTAVIAEADIVVNALNLPYDKWDRGRAEAQLAMVIAAMGTSDKTMMYPGNVYNFAASDRRIMPSTPQEPQTPRGAIRVRQEQMLAEAAKAGKFQVIIIRAGDFYGPGNSGDWFDQAMMLDVAKGRIHHMAALAMSHCWAYLPDLGGAFARVADVRSTLADFENFHFAGHYVTHAVLMQAIAQCAPLPLKVTPMPWMILQAMGLVRPVIREVVKMRYLWNNPMELIDPRLDAILGPQFGTPFAQAVQAATRQFHAARQAA